MIQALIQRWLAGQDPSAPEARQKCGALAGMVGILLNTLLCLGKLAAGMITGSVAIVADALNNLSDAASSVITLVGFRLAGQAADEEHPFGHGRMEYLTGLVVSMAILLMGFELGKSSVEKLIHPEELDFSWLAAAILAAAVLVKLAAKDTLDPLLGRPMDPELARDIDKLVVSHPNILGIHDLVYHDYGPGRAMMSFHAEVPADADLLEMHDIIDHIERELKEKHHIETVIHMDPVVNDERTAALRAQVEQLAHGIDPVLSIHDLRITAGPRHTNVLFDVMVPYGFRLTDSQVRGELSRGVKGLSDKYTAVIEVDHSYVEQREHP